jgi:hypothetical protein
MPPEGRTVGVWTTPGPNGTDWYRPLGGWTTVVRVLLMSVATMSVAIALLSVMINRDLSGSLHLPRSAADGVDWAAVQAWGGLLAALQLTLVVLAGVGIVLWTRRAYRNLPALDVSGARLARRWAVLGWLIPGVNFVVPKRVLDDTWRASDPAAHPWTTGWLRTPVPTPNHLWTICSFVGLPVVVLVEVPLLFGSLPPHGDVHSVAVLYLVLALAQVLLMTGAGMLARVVGTIGDRQRDRAEALGPASPFVPSTPEPAPESAPALVRPVLVRSAEKERAGLY